MHFIYIEEEELEEVEFWFINREKDAYYEHDVTSLCNTLYPDIRLSWSAMRYHPSFYESHWKKKDLYLCASIL